MSNFSPAILCKKIINARIRYVTAYSHMYTIFSKVFQTFKNWLRGEEAELQVGAPRKPNMHSFHRIPPK
jgi:hypothetical protein